MILDLSNLPTTLIGLVGFLVACVAFYLLYLLRAKWRMIESVTDEERRARLINSTLAQFHFDFSKLHSKDKVDLAKAFLESRAKNLRFLALLGSAVFLISLVILAVVGWNSGPVIPEPVPDTTKPVPDSDPNARVLYYKGQILALRGDIEAKNQDLERDLRSRGLQLADLIGDIEEDGLKPAVKIIKHEYGGWALVMGVSTFSDAPPEYLSAESRSRYARRAADEFNQAIHLMKKVADDYADGVPAAIALYEWMTGPSGDWNRTRYLKAIALAVTSRADQSDPRAAIEVLKEIEPLYLAKNPADSNPDLAWALSQSKNATPASP